MNVRVVGNLDARRTELWRGNGTHVSLNGETAPEVLFVWAQRRTDLADLVAEHGSRLRWVHFRRVGIPESTVRLFDPFPHIQLTNGSGASGIAVAEHAIALLLALFKRLPTLRESQQRHEWPREFPAFELYGHTVGIVGLGDVGLSVARLLRPFGVRLLGVRRRPESVAEVDETFTTEALGDVLARCSILILAPPLTGATRHMIGAAELAQLPTGAYIINVGRGATVDEAALIAALRDGGLAGAGLDVLEDEPLAADSPLWDMPNVIITPHSAAHTEGTDDRSVLLFLDNLQRFCEARPLLSPMARNRP